VKARDAFTVQLATNQKKQKMIASCAISFTVSGAISGPRLDLTTDSAYVRRRMSMAGEIQSLTAYVVLVIVHCKGLVFFGPVGVEKSWTYTLILE
jgi:sRNA-binding regulator protein Hfq